MKRKQVTADFEGSLIPSDGEVAQLREAGLALIYPTVCRACNREWRDPALVVRTWSATPRFRILAIAYGYEDADDCHALRERALTSPGYELDE